MASANSGTRLTNLLISFWKEHRNLGVLSSTDRVFVEELRQWAKKKGYRVEVSPDKDES